MKYYTNEEIKDGIYSLSESDFEFLSKEFCRISHINKISKERFIEIFQNQGSCLTIIPNTGNIFYDLYYFIT